MLGRDVARVMEEQRAREAARADVKVVWRALILAGNGEGATAAQWGLSWVCFSRAARGVCSRVRVWDVPGVMLFTCRAVQQMQQVGARSQ